MQRFRARGTRRAWIVLALYVLVFLSSPILHHDLDCHLRNPGHCNACTANPQAPRIETSLGLAVAALPEAGSIETARPTSLAPPACPPRSGRAPPA